MTPRPRISATGLAVAALLLLPVAVLCAVWWPGHINADFLRIYSEAETGKYTNWAAPIVSVLIRGALPLGAGPGWVLTAQLVLLSAGLYAALRAGFRPVAAAAVAAAVMLLPQTFGFVSSLGRDLWFAETTLLTVGALVVASRADDERRRRWLRVAIVGFLAMAFARQNALFAIFPLALGWWDIRSRGAAGTGPRFLGLSVRGAAVAAALAVGLTIVAAAAVLPLKPRNAYPQAWWYIYDLAAISVRTGDDVFPPSSLTSTEQAVRDRFDVRGVENFANFSDSTTVHFPRDDAAAARLQTAWRKAVLAHPWAYLRERWTTFALQTGMTAPPTVIFHPGIDGNPFGWTVTNPELEKAGRDYVTAFSAPGNTGSPLQAVWAYLLITLAATPFLLRSPRPERRVIGWLGLAVLGYQVSLFIAAMGVQYRLEFPAVLCATVVAIVAAVEFRDRWRGRPAATREQADDVPTTDSVAAQEPSPEPGEPALSGS